MRKREGMRGRDEVSEGDGGRERGHWGYYSTECIS